jgi:hypothetical protein
LDVLLSVDAGARAQRRPIGITPVHEVETLREP